MSIWYFTAFVAGMFTGVLLTFLYGIWTCAKIEYDEHMNPICTGELKQARRERAKEAVERCKN
jgi:hypothetical protein